MSDLAERLGKEMCEVTEEDMLNDKDGIRIAEENRLESEKLIN